MKKIFRIILIIISIGVVWANDLATAKKLEEKAFDFSKKGDYQKSIISLKKSLHIKEKILNKDDPYIATSYDDIGLAYHYAGNYSKALYFYQRALTIREKVLGQEHLDTILSYNNLGGLYYTIGDYPKALIYHKKALTTKERVLGKVHSNTSLSYNNIGLVYQAIGNYEKALNYYQKALTIQKKLFTKKPEQVIELVAISYNNISGLYHNVGDYPKSLDYLEQALLILKKILGKEHPDIALNYNNMGELYRNMGNYPKALNYFQKALNIRKKVLGKEHPDTAMSYNNIGELYRNIGNNLKSFNYLQKALNIREKIFENEHPDLAQSYNNIGVFYKDMDNYKKAFNYFQKALDIKEKIFGKKHPDTALGYNNVGSVYQDVGNYSKALFYYEKALIIFEKVLGKEHVNTATNYDNIGYIYAIIDKNPKALNYYKKALNIRKKILGIEHIATAKSYNHIAILYQNQKKYTQSYLNIKKSFDILYSNMNKNFQILDKEEKKSYLKSNSVLLSLLEISYLYKKTTNQKTKYINQEILNSWINYKRTIFNTENSLKLLYSQTKNKTIKSKIDELYLFQKRLARLYQNTPQDNKKIKWYKKSIQETKENISKLEIWLSSKSSKLYTQNINYQDIINLIKPNELYIDFAKAEENYYYFILDKQNNITFEQFNTNKSIEIDRTIKKILNDKEYLISTAQKNYNKLYKLIFNKIDLKNKTSLIISHDGELNKIPFEALYDGEKYLIQKLNIRYIPSGKEFVKLYQHNSKSNNRVIVFANPSFGLNANERKESQLKGSTIESLYNQTNKGKENYFDTLTNQDEPKIIKKLYGKNAQIYLGKDATESNFFKIKSPKILHLSTHGFYLQDKTILNPMLKAGIALSGANIAVKNKKGDGIITALELSGMDLSHTELVVLSACETGVGEIEDGEGVAGLSKAFMKAGAKYIVMSLWSVPDKSTGELMKRFYENLHRGDGYSGALRKAKIWMIENRNSHPYYWSGFVGSGRD